MKQVVPVKSNMARCGIWAVYDSSAPSSNKSNTVNSGPSWGLPVACIVIIIVKWPLVVTLQQHGISVSSQNQEKQEKET